MVLNIVQNHINGQFDVWERITHGAKEGKAGSREEPKGLLFFRESIQAGGDGCLKGRG